MRHVFRSGTRKVNRVKRLVFSLLYGEVRLNAGYGSTKCRYAQTNVKLSIFQCIRKCLSAFLDDPFPLCQKIRQLDTKVLSRF